MGGKGEEVEEGKGREGGGTLEGHLCVQVVGVCVWVEWVCGLCGLTLGVYSLGSGA